ncbi:Ubiquitin-protein ligase E3C, partial [Exaiptasia diaphana]
SCPDDSDGDSDSDMEVEYNQDDKLDQLRDECLKILDSKEHVKSLESLVTVNINKTNPIERLLYTLALNPVFIHQLWIHILNKTITTGTGKEIPILQLIHQGQNLTTTEASHIVPMLSLFCALFSHSLFSVGDKEFFGEQKGSDTFGKAASFA